MPHRVIPVAQYEKPRRCVQDDGTVYLRSGHCSRCGACCQADVVTGEAVPCRFLVTVDNVYGCNGRDTAHYLRGCNVWPEHPSQIVTYPDCTYTFERVA